MSTPTILFLAPGYPAEMPHFVRGLSEAGARVLGVGDQPVAMLPELCKRHLSDYLQVPSLWDELAVVETIRRWGPAQAATGVESLWEPLMVLAARLREGLGLPGMNVAQTIPFRDKEVMKQRLDEAGLRTPRHARATTVHAVWQAAEQLGFPLIIKPIAGAGSADTYRVDGVDDLRAVLPRLRHVPEVSVEEFIDGEEYTYDTITVGGQVMFDNVAWYRPRPLIARSHEWISPQVITLRHPHQAELADGVALGRAVLEALDFGTGFTHMEWFRKADGEVVFGEIGARPPGARQVDKMNYTADIDVYREWGNAIAHGIFESRVERGYNVAVIFKRAQGRGRIQGIVGEELLDRYARHIVWNDLLPVGAMRRNWRQTLVSDGFVMLRHPELTETLVMADRIAADLHLYAS